MSKQQDRESLVQEIKEAAKLYKDNLVGKRFLYVFDGRYIEVIYKAENFRHLTGVDTHLSAKSFYSDAARGKLTERHVFFSARHPYSLCVKKVKHIKNAVKLAEAESFMLEEIVTDTQYYKFGTTEANFTLCMNPDIGHNGNLKSECYVVESLRDDDCFEKSKNVYEVTHIFSKPNDEKFYSKLHYMASNTELPDSVKKMLAPELLENAG